MASDGVLLPCAQFREILVEAYRPCPSLSGPCRTLRWDPAGGWVPCGFLGAVGSPEDVKLWIVLADPAGQPWSDQGGLQGMPPEKMLERVGTLSFHHYNIAPQRAFSREHRSSSHHETVRYLLDLCLGDRYPRFEDQLRLTWLCNAVLCFVPSGGFPNGIEEACGSRYLMKMAKLIPNAYVLPLGEDARRRVRRAGINAHFKGKAYHPGGSHMEHNPQHRQRGLESYQQAARSFRKHMGWLE